MKDAFYQWLSNAVDIARQEEYHWSQQSGSSGNYMMSQEKVEILEEVLKKYITLGR